MTILEGLHREALATRAGEVRSSLEDLIEKNGILHVLIQLEAICWQQGKKEWNRVGNHISLAVIASRECEAPNET